MKTRFKGETGRRLRQVGAILSMTGLSVGMVNAQDKPASTAQAASVPVVGKVVAPAGKPIKDAAVFWIERDEEGGVQRRFTADTDAQGQFRFAQTAPKPGERRFVILAVQASEWGLSFQNLPIGPDASKPVSITLQPSTTLRVAFLDPSGKPLPNLPVRVSALFGQNMGFLEIPAAMHGRWEQKTDSKGECAFPGLPQGAQARFAVDREEFAALSFEDAVTLGKAATQQAPPIRLMLGGVVQGRVTSGEDGKPVAGVRVFAQAAGAGDGWGQAVTDAQGNYRLTGLRPAAYNISIQLKGEQEKNLTARALEKTDVKAGVALTNQNLTLIRGSLVTGKVTDKSTGKPVAGVMIGIYGPARPRSGAGVQSTTTDANGAYQARVPAGAQYVYVMGLPSTNYERPKEGVNVTVGEDAPHTQDFVLSPSLAQNLKPVHGRVVGVDGKLIGGAKISVVPVTQDGYFSIKEIETDASGAFTLQMTTSSSRLRARSGALATETTILAQSGEDITLHLKPNTLLTLGGMVTDDKGKPLAAAKVMLIEWWLDTGMGNVNTTTDAQGHFAFTDLYPDARYSISAEAAGFGNQASQVTQYKPGEKAEVTIPSLPRADSFVVGRVVDDNGDPVARQSVRLQGRASKYQEVITDAQGRFRFEGVVNEPLTLYLYDDKGFSLPKKAVAGDKDVIIVHKSAGVPQAKADADAQEAARKQQIALLSQPGPRLQAAAWLNTKAAMPEGLKGKIVLIDFWAISCGPCVASLPAVQKVSEQFGGRGVVVVGLHASGMEKDTLASFLHAHNVTYPIAIDTDDPQHQTFGQIMRSYGVQGIPTVAVLDRDGVVRYLDYGLEGAIKVVGDLLVSQK